MKEFQTTSLGLWNHAREFAEAASVVAEAAGDKTPLPAYYLWGHSIELSLKAFLFGCGVPLRKLKSKELGHDLKALAREALSHNLKTVVHLDSQEIAEIDLLNYDYVAKHFEYHETKTYHLPFKHRTKRIAEKLVRLTKRHCENAGK
jgi:HEPN domain-containing protein